MSNTEAATESVTYDSAAIIWLRGDASPEVQHTTFDYSTNRVNWIPLGAGTRISGGWQLSGVSVPVDASVRARAFLRGGQYNGSGWFVESGTGPISITSDPLPQTNNAGTTESYEPGATQL